MLQLTVKQRKARSRHPWIFRDDVVHLPRQLSDGAEADLLDERQNYLGRGLISANSQIVCRLYSSQRLPLDRDFFRRRIQAAADLRKSLQLPSDQTDGFRLVFAEGDLLPGLTVDRYGDYLVFQTPTAAMDLRKGMLVDILAELFRPQGICERNDMPVREAEGLPLTSGWLTGQGASTLRIRENGLIYEIDPLGAMKTGHFFDQRENRRLLEGLCQGRDVLEVFSYSGGFGLTAARYGAKSVLCVDASAKAIEMVKKNAALNGVEATVQTQVGDGFDVLRELVAEKRTFDVVILDPPAFAKRKEHVEQAARGYKQINLRALQLLRPGGHLLTCSCSFTVSREEFRRQVSSAAQDAGLTLRLIAEGRAGGDHPVLLHVPQTDYLKAMLVMGGTE